MLSRATSDVDSLVSLVDLSLKPAGVGSLISCWVLVSSVVMGSGMCSMVAVVWMIGLVAVWAGDQEDGPEDEGSEPLQRLFMSSYRQFWTSS